MDHDEETEPVIVILTDDHNENKSELLTLCGLVSVCINTITIVCVLGTRTNKLTQRVS